MPFASMTLRSFGPALPPARPIESLQGALGAMLGLFVTHAVLWAIESLSGLTQGGILANPMLMAPLGATAVLIYAVPASPLAQPWSVVAGNLLSATLALGLLQLGWPPVATLMFAIVAALGAMATARCLHPPGGAVALATVLAAPSGLQGSLIWLGLTVLVGSTLLVLSGVAFHRITGRIYPFGSAHSAALPAAEPDHVLPSPLVLAAALGQLRLEGTLGVDDLARLIETAEALAPHPFLTANGIMSKNPVAVGPMADWREMSALFVQHGVRNLAVVDGLNRFLGIVPVHVILRPGAQGLSARHLMQTDIATADPKAALSDLLPALAHGGQTCLPVLDQDGSLCGLITRSDILASLVHATANPHEKDPDDPA